MIPDLPVDKTLDDLPEWACSWCGFSAGILKACRRCGCSFLEAPPSNLHVRLTNAAPEEIGNFFIQCNMIEHTALARIRRMSRKGLRKAGGTRDLQGMMLDEDPPDSVIIR